MANTAEGKAPYEVTISPDLCCLEISQNDFDCDVSYHSKITKYRGMGSITDVWDYDSICLCYYVSQCSCDPQKHSTWARLTDSTTRPEVFLSSFETWYMSIYE